MTETKKIPVTILTGFLGAGKTTLLNHLISQTKHERVALIINEFGEVGIDDKLILRTEEEIIELNNGVICCAFKTDTTKSLLKLVENKGLQFDRVIIELSGVANPIPLARLLLSKPELIERYTLSGIVTVVDAGRIASQLQSHPEAKEQIAAADVILLNKIDLAEARTLGAAKMAIRNINPIAAVHEVTRGEITVDALFQAFEHTFVTEHTHSDDHHHDSELASMVLEASKPLDLQKVSQWIGELLLNHENLVRYKGLLDIAGFNERFVFQGVHELFENRKDRPWAASDDRKSQVVLIGRNLNKQELQDSFNTLIA